jgi:hypothetical protein
MPITQEQALLERTRSLSLSGSIWSDKVVEKQRPLVRQLSLNAIGVDQGTDLLGTGQHLAAGGPQIRGTRSWAFVEQDIKWASPGRWGYITHQAPVAGELPDYIFRLNQVNMLTPEVVENMTGEPLPFIQRDGLISILPPGAASSSTSPDGFLYSPDIPYYSGTANIGSAVFQSKFLAVNYENEEQFLIVNEDYLVQLSDSDSYVVRSLESAWFLKLPAGILVLALETEIGDLTEGTSYFQVDGWLVLRHDPYQLWPDGIAHATTTLRAPDSSKHFVLKTDRSKAPGRWVANYKRQSQSPGAFVRALAEVAGLPIYEEDDRIMTIEPAGTGHRYHTVSGNAFLLPGDYPRALLDLRCQALYGDKWWLDRPWAALGIHINFVRPGFYDFYINDVATVAESYEDPVNGALRAKIHFNQDIEEEERYWAWQAGVERYLDNELFARDILGFTAAGDYRWVNPLEVYAKIYSPWLWVVESPLVRYHSGIWKEVQDFIAREKPSGAVVASLAI